MELREQTKGALHVKIPQLAMRAFVASRRVEKRLDELLHYLGLTTTDLKLDPEHVKSFHAACADFTDIPGRNSPAELMEWARKLLAVTEDYLTLMAQVTGDQDSWKVLMVAANTLVSACSKGSSTRTYAEHARNNLRNVAYLHLRDTQGQRKANQQFPKESLVKKLLKRALTPGTAAPSKSPSSGRPAARTRASAQ